MTSCSSASYNFFLAHFPSGSYSLQSVIFLVIHVDMNNTGIIVFSAHLQ